VDLLRALARPPTSELPGEAIEKVLEGGYEEFLKAEFLNADSRIEDVRQLAEYARGYEDTETFLSEIALLTELSAETVSEGGEPDEKMVLSSVHQAKGLEWRAVFVVWLADGRFPSAQALKDRDGEEEERRLFYVAATRAKDELYLTYPLVAAPRDRERVVMKASRFLEELPPAEPELFERWHLDEPGAGGGPALGPGAEPARLPSARDPRVVPALFGPAGDAGGRDGAAKEAANEALRPAIGWEDGADPAGDGDDVPF
jgi:DNA helicase-2/ATP-dependent DNA helicase PcrA